jgi:aminopeptidase
MQPTISRQDLDTWAGYLLNHSLDGITPNDVVMVKGEPVTWPLMAALQDKIIAAGAVADVCLVPPDNDRGRVWGAAVARLGSPDQIARVPPWHRQRYEAMTKYIEILGAERPDLYANLPAEAASAIVKADEPFKNIRLAKQWLLTLYPTQGFADLEGLTLEEYTRVIVRASTIDPQMLEAVEEEIHRIMSRTRRMRIVTACPKTGRTLELGMSIAGQRIVKCVGKRNFPDGEIFTSPDANSVDGEIFLDLPVLYSGATIRGIYLRLESGVIKEYTADEGFEILRSVVETDAGSRRLGEVALGMNNGLERALKHPLFVEKVGGTLHIAIGNSYKESYVDDPDSPEGKARLDELARQGAYNTSAQHVDIVTDFRPGGAGRAVYLDDVQLRLEDNIWVVPR